MAHNGLISPFVDSFAVGIRTLGLALLFAISLMSAPAGAVERDAAGVDRIPMSFDVSAQLRVVGTAVGVLDTSCADYRLCTWDRRDYEGGKVIYSPGHQGWWDTVVTVRSSKNRYGDRAVGFYNINTGERVRCLNPTTNLPGPFPDATQLLYIGVDGSRC